MQRGLVAETLLSAASGTNIEQVVWELEELPDIARFQAAWQAALDCFDALRVVFDWSAAHGQTQQRVVGAVRLPVEVVREEAHEGVRGDFIEAFLARDREAGFDLEIAPLLRVTLLALRGGRAVCVWTVHHAIIDGASFSLVLDRVWQAYLGRAPEPAPPQFRDFVRWLEAFDDAEGIEHFAQLLSGFREPTPLPGPGHASAPSGRKAKVRRRLDASVARGLEQVARDCHSSPTAVVQLAWALLLSRYSGGTDVVFGVTWSGRRQILPTASEIVGPFINSLPVRVDLTAAPTIREQLERLRASNVAMRPFQQVPLQKIKAATEASGLAQLFETLVVFDYDGVERQLCKRSPEWEGHRVRNESQAGLPLVLAATLRSGEELALELEYDEGLYDPGAAERLLSDYVRALAGLQAGLDRAPLEVELLEPSLLERLTTHEVERERVPRSPTPIERFLRQAELTPEQSAIEQVGGAQLSYGAARLEVLRLAEHLRACGVGPGDLVGVCLPRSPEAVLTLLAIHAAGAAFINLDPRDPPSRAEYVLKDSHMARLIVSGETRGQLKSAGAIELNLDALPAHSSGETFELCLPEPDALAYLIYTSGSTGEPKGVCVTQSALANHAYGIAQEYALTASDRVLQFASFTFDLALEEIFPTLATGATLVLRSDEMIVDAASLFEAVTQARLTVLNLPSAYFHQLVETDEPWPSSARLVVVGGERVSPEAHQKFREGPTGHIRWLNAYGPTETTITSTSYDDAEGDHDARDVPIGRAVHGVSHFVLDPQMRVVPPGSVGQLYIGGAGLAQGYLNRKELTERQFVPHPFNPGARLYATGDRVRLTPRGNYVYVDRADNQVKIRGYRIELGEIEAQLRRHPAVLDSAVVQLERRRDVLVGFVASESVTEEELRRELVTALPSYMVPKRIVVTSSLPLTSAGKVDRKALAQTQLPRTASSPPRMVKSPILAEVLHIWEDTLDTPVTNASLSFFDLGGHSLQLVRMLTRVQRRFGKAPGLRTFLENPTAEQLASLLASEGASAVVRGVTQLASGEADARPLFFAPGLTGREMDYVHLARALPGEIPLYGLRLGDLCPDEGDGQPLEEVARRLADTVERVQSRGPYAIAGYSAGGVCATLIAQELRARGHELSLVGLIDCVPPSTVPIPSPLSSPRRAYRLARTVFGRTREIVATDSGLLGLARRVSAAAVRSAARWRLLSREYRPAVESYFGDEPSDYTREEMKAMQRYLDAVEVHAFSPLNLDLRMPQASP